MNPPRKVPASVRAALQDLRSMGVTFVRNPKSSAEICRTNGWVVGDVLEGNEGYGADRIVITAIGEDGVLARKISVKNGEAVNARESAWSLDARPWVKVDHIEGRR
jgi:hypothetical protein